MEVEYSLGLEDLLAFNLYHGTHSPTLRRQQVISRLALLFGVAVGWLLMSEIAGKIVGPSAWIIFGFAAALVGVVFFVSYPALLRHRMRRLVGRMYMEGQNRGLFTRRRLTITPETITDATEISVTTMKWVAVEKIAIDQRHVYFYTGSASALILPKAAFGTEAEFNEFVETAQRYQRQAAG
jgi:hypothetical protein